MPDEYVETAGEAIVEALEKFLEEKKYYDDAYDHNRNPTGRRLDEAKEALIKIIDHNFKKVAETKT